MTRIPCVIVLFLLAPLALLAVGSKSARPATTLTKSSKFATVQEKADFLQQYVTFRRTYETLDFDVAYHNNGGGGGVPGPSDWDVRLVATVPEVELAAWVPPGAKPLPSPPDVGWLKSHPHNPRPLRPQRVVPPSAVTASSPSTAHAA